MAQKALFNFTKRSDKKRDAKILDSRGKRVTVANTTNISGNSYTNAVTRAKSMSERILGKVLGRLELVTDIEKIEDWAELAADNGICAIDTETAGLHAYKDSIASICLYTPGSKGIYVPVAHISNLTKMPLKENVSKSYLKELFEWLIKEIKIKVVYHNAKFEFNVFYWQLGVDLGEPYWDTQIGSTLLNENESHVLKEWHMKYIQKGDENSEVAKFNDLFKGIPFTLIPPDVGYMYAGYDPIMTYECYEFQKQYLDANEKECKEAGLQKVAWLFRNIEMPLIKVLFDMEKRGITLDEDKLQEISDDFKGKLEAAENKLLDIINLDYPDELHNFKINFPESYDKIPQNADGELVPNLSSVPQIAAIIYDMFELESNDKNKPRGTGDEILEGMNHPFTKELQAYRSVNKIITTYTTYDKWLAEQDNRIHTSYRQNGAKTGRMSSTDPSIMNIPAHGDGKIMRTVFRASKGYKLVGSDYSQQEPHILAFISQDKDMIQAYRDGRDLYAFLGSVVYDCDYEDCLEFNEDGSQNKEGKHRRNSMKSVLLGIMYGRQEASIAEQLGISVKEAKKIIKLFFKSFPNIADTMNRVQQGAIDFGFVETLGGRKRRLPEMQFDPIEITPSGEGKAEGVDLLDFDSEDQEEYVPEDVWSYYASEFQRAWGFKRKQELREQALSEGYIIKDNGGFIADAERQCLNSVIQGSAADMTKLAMVLIHNDKELKDLDFHLLIPVHDELIGEAPKENSEAAGNRLSALMVEAYYKLLTNAYPDYETLPIKCDVEITDYWYQGEFENK